MAVIQLRCQNEWVASNCKLDFGLELIMLYSLSCYVILFFELKPAFGAGFRAKGLIVALNVMHL